MVVAEPKSSPAFLDIDQDGTINKKEPWTSKCHAWPEKAGLLKVLHDLSDRDARFRRALDLTVAASSSVSFKPAIACPNKMLPAMAASSLKAIEPDRRGRIRPLWSGPLSVKWRDYAHYARAD